MPPFLHGLGSHWLRAMVEKGEENKENRLKGQFCQKIMIFLEPILTNVLVNDSRVHHYINFDMIK